MRPSLLLVAVLLLAVLAPMPAPAQAQGECATFEVLHDDRIGGVEFPAGSWRMHASGDVSCAEASDLFARFLEDFDGRLPKPWRVRESILTLCCHPVDFRRGDGPDGFFVWSDGTRVDGGGRHPRSGTRCPGTFTVLHDDRVGRRWIPGGHYRITLLSTPKTTCARAAALFARFLADFDGVLPRPWALDVPTATFRRGTSQVGFRIKPYAETPTAGSGSGSHPRHSKLLCPFPFNVLHDDRIGKLRLPRKQYRITRLSRDSLSCQAAATRLRRFLGDSDGMLPPPWKLNVQTATFTRGPASAGFRVKPYGLIRP
jgi:hypothetical protein